MAEMEAPKERAPRWMNDKDCGQNLTLIEVNKLDNGDIELVYETETLHEQVRRTTNSTKPEYKFLFNCLGSKDWTGSTVRYDATKSGRIPVSATR